MESESAAHDQQPLPQNQDSPGSTSLWRSRVRSCFSVSVSLSSALWTRRQDQGRNQEEISQWLSHYCLQKSRVRSHVLFYSFFCGFVIFFFNSLHPLDQSSAQQSSARPFVTEAVFNSTWESELSTSLASLASLKPVTSMIMAMASTFKAAQDAAAVSGDRPHAQDDVIMLSADPVLTVNSQDQEALDAAHVRTEIAMSNLTISSHSAPASLVSYAVPASLPSKGWTCVVCQIMSSSSHQASRQQVRHLTSRGSWRPRTSAIGSSSMMQNSSSISSIMCFKFLASRSQVTNSSGNSTRVFKTRYITWSTSQWLTASVMDHQHHQQTSPLSTQSCQGSWSMVIFSTSKKRTLQGSNPSIFISKHLVTSGFLASWTRFRSRDHSHRFLDQVEVQVSSCQLMFSTMSWCQCQTDSWVRHFHSSFITAQHASTSDFTRSWSSIILIFVNVFCRHHLVKRWSLSTASWTLKQWSYDLILKVLINWHQCHQIHCQQFQAQDQQHHQDQVSLSN